MLEWVEDVRNAIAADCVPDTRPVEISVVRINDITIVCLPLELYSEVGFDIRARLDDPSTVIAGYCNGICSYLASRKAKAQGGYGPDTAVRWCAGALSPFSPDAAGILIDSVAKVTDACRRR